MEGIMGAILDSLLDSPRRRLPLHPSATTTTDTTATTTTTDTTTATTDGDLLDTCGEYEERRKIRMRLKSLMAEKKAQQGEVSGHGRGAGQVEAGGAKAAGGGAAGSGGVGEGDKGTVSPFGASTELRTGQAESKTVSPFEKFKKLDSKQSPRPANGRGGPAGGAPLFQLSTQLTRSASGVKDLLLNWCQCRTRDYKGVKIENFSTSWNDGMAFCALIHHFYPDAFDFDKLNPKNRRHNFELAFRVADEKAGVMPLLDVEDMVVMKKPDWKCVFTYVQSLYKRLKDE